MSPPESIASKTLYLTNPDGINALYEALGQQACFDSGDIVLETKAGSIILDHIEAEELFSSLQDLDTRDNESRLRDGHIIAPYLDNIIFSQGNYDRVVFNQGLKIHFKEFRPSSLWNENYLILQRMREQNILVDRVLEDTISEENFWMAVTQATLSNFSPAVDAQIISGCNAMNHCYPYFLARAKIGSAMSMPQADGLHIYFNLSYYWNESSATWLVAHERGHDARRSFAKSLGDETFADSVLNWAFRLDSGDAADVKALWQIIASPLIQRTREQSENFFFHLSYVLDESVDAAYFESLEDVFGTVPNQEAIRNGGTLLQELIKGSQSDFEKRYKDNYVQPEVIALYLALHRSLADGPEISDSTRQEIHQKAEILLTKLGEDYLQLYRTTYQMIRIGKKYIKSPEFQTRIRSFLK